MKTDKIRSSYKNVLKYSMQDSCVNLKNLWIKEGHERCLKVFRLLTYICIEIVCFLLLNKNFITLCESELEKNMVQSLLKG